MWLWEEIRWPCPFPGSPGKEWTYLKCISKFASKTILSKISLHQHVNYKQIPPSVGVFSVSHCFCNLLCTITCWRQFLRLNDIEVMTFIKVYYSETIPERMRVLLLTSIVLLWWKAGHVTGVSVQSLKPVLYVSGWATRRERWYIRRQEQVLTVW